MLKRNRQGKFVLPNIKNEANIVNNKKILEPIMKTSTVFLYFKKSKKFNFRKRKPKKKGFESKP